MEIRTPALHSVLGRGFLCLSPPPSPHLLSSYFISTIWCLLMAASSPLEAPHSNSRLQYTVPPVQPNIAHLVLPVLSPPSHPSSCPHLFTHPVQSPRGPVSSQPLHFHSHCLGGVSSPIYGPSPTMTPLPLLFPFHLILLPGLLKSTFLSVLTFSVQSLSGGSWL